MVPGLPDTPAYGTILVPTDFSKTAERALDLAVQIALGHGAQIHLVHAVEAVSMPSMPLEIQQTVTRNLADLEEVVRKAGLTVMSHYDATGKPWVVVAKAERRLAADLIVMGTHGRRRTPQVLGTTADRVIRSAQTPILTVQPDVARPPEIRTVLVATDFSEEAALATSAAVRLAGRMVGQTQPISLVLLHAWSTPLVYGEPPWLVPKLPPTGEIEKEARHTLESLAATLRGDRVNVEVRVREGDAAEVITSEAERIKADLIALGTVGRSGLNRLLLGSVAEQVLHRAPCPVLTVRQPLPTEPIQLAEEQKV
ncbi:MAG: universal stress protein [Planctomycetota bacterium]|jgi:nucleotide-binding universal stress UspA family protein